MIRRAVLDDAEAIARVHIATWRAAYRGIVPDAFLHAMSLDVRIASWQKTLGGTDLLTWVATGDDGPILGFVARTAVTDPAEVYGMYVAAEAWGQGFGQALLGAAIAGCGTVELWTFEASQRARRFYEAAGFRTDGQRRVKDRGGVAAAEIHYIVRPPSTSTVLPLK